MIVVADASALVAELLRARGRELVAHPDLRVVVAEERGTSPNTYNAESVRSSNRDDSPSTTLSACTARWSLWSTSG